MEYCEFFVGSEVNIVGCLAVPTSLASWSVISSTSSIRLSNNWVCPKSFFYLSVAFLLSFCSQTVAILTLRARSLKASKTAISVQLLPQLPPRSILQNHG